MTITSDPFVVPNARGYSAAITIRRDGAQQEEHLLLSAMTLAKGIKLLANVDNSLIGQKLAVRKKGPKKTDPFEVRRD
jgi:hypothetical protein